MTAHEVVNPTTSRSRPGRHLNCSLRSVASCLLRQRRNFFSTRDTYLRPFLGATYVFDSDSSDTTRGIFTLEGILPSSRKAIKIFLWHVFPAANIRNCSPFRSTWVHPCFSGIRVTRSLLFCVVFCWWLIVLLKFFFWPLRCLSFDLRILITHLVSGNSSFNHKTFKFIYRYQYIYCNWLLSVNLFVLFFD